jgi:hypothetical protein
MAITNRDETKQFQHLTRQITEWGKATTLKKMTWFEARMAVRHTIGHKLTYPLPATTLTQTHSALNFSGYYKKKSWARWELSERHQL